MASTRWFASGFPWGSSANWDTLALTNSMTDALGQEATQALAGFSDAPVIMIATLFIVGEGLSQTGVTAWMGGKMVNLAGTSPARLLVLMMIVAVSASTAFLTTIGTTTNLLVMAPGGYQFKDYLKVGAPFLFLIISIILVPLIWPF